MKFVREPQHIAIAGNYYLGGLSVIHTRSDMKSGKQLGKVVEHRLDDVWTRRIVKVFR
jgi:hypothetical protein